MQDATVGPARLRAIAEALAFAAEEPLTLGDLADLFPGTQEESLRAALDEVARACEAPDRGLRLNRAAGGHRLVTKAELGGWVRALFRSRNRRRLSTQALETLAIIAYRQPITTPEIQALRGADPGAVLEGLLEKKLVRILGRKKVVGKPVLYGTTREFLAHFGINSLEDLPSLEDLGRAAPGPDRVQPPGPAGAAGPFEEGNGEDDGSESDEDGDFDDDETEKGDDGDDS
ncbi:MAG: SMC-Scp complex subunit ScpB [Acidobacteria bacterium]|nr:SMC-Scp complex subunit ScpB [Acidobacteriota bacterium]